MNRRDILSTFALTPTGALARSSINPVSAGLGLMPDMSLPLALKQADHINNTVQLQAAIDASHQAGGAMLVIPPGTYRVRELRLAEGVHLVGLGRVIFKLFDPGTDGYIARIIGQSDVRIENIQFDCTIESGRENTVGCVEVAANSVRRSSDIIFSNCRFLNAQNNAWIILRRVECVTINNCQFLDHLRETEGATHGLSLSEDSNSIRITDCLFDHPSGFHSPNVSKAHIGIDRATNIWIDRCIIRRAVRNGITIEDNQELLVQTVKLQDCIISECGNSGLQIEGNGLLDLSVRGCDFKDNASFGIRLASGRSFSGRVDGCTFTDNAAIPDSKSGHAQMQVNLKPGQIVQVSNCLFSTRSSANGFVHFYYLNGEASVTGCSFVGGANGFGIYAPVDAEKQLQRATASFRDLRFIDVGTPTFRLPQFFGDDWQYGGGEPKKIESIFSKLIQSDRTAQIIDIWTASPKNFYRGNVFIILELLIVVDSIISGNRFQFTVSRDAVGIDVSPITQTPINMSETAGKISSIELLPTDVVEQGARRTRIGIRVNTPNPRQSLAVTATGSIKLLWNGFSSAPVLI